MLVEIIDNQFRMSEEVLKFATDEEIKYIREICKSIICRAEHAKAEMKGGAA